MSWQVVAPRCGRIEPSEAQALASKLPSLAGHQAAVVQRGLDPSARVPFVGSAARPGLPAREPLA